MNKNFIFYRCFLERGMAGDGEPGLLAATEVVQAVCDAGFQRNGLSMKCYPSSPHCYFKYAKTPKEGMYMLRAVKKTDMTTLDILIDTRLYPSFVMIEKHRDWQEEAEEVKDTLEQVINDNADKFNWHVNLKEHKTNTTQNLEEFVSALSYMKEQEDMHEKHYGPVHIGQIGQLILKVNGDNYYSEGEKLEEEREEDVVKTNEEMVEKHEEDNPLLSDKATKYWKRLKQYRFVDEHYMLLETTSRQQAMYIAEAFSEILHLRKKWKTFEGFWGIKNLAQEKNKFLELGKSPARSAIIDRIFED